MSWRLTRHLNPTTVIAVAVILALGLTTALAAQSEEPPRPKTKPAAALWRLEIGGVSG